MDFNARMEQFSNAFLLAVASVAGCSVAKPSVDNDSIDWTISNRMSGRPKLDVQLKSTSNDDDQGRAIHFPLKRKNYDDLIDANRICPLALVLVVVPARIEDWIYSTRAELALRRCAYWMSLAGQEPTENEISVTINVPRAQLFTVESLGMLMETISRGGSI
jgi:hypothetical protein